MKIIALAAGYATRLHPLTLDCPKALLDVGGRPILSRILECIVMSAPVDEICVVSNARFFAHFERWAVAFRTSAPLRVLNDGTHGEATRLGAVGDLAFALRESPPTGDWLVVAGDNLLELDLASALRDFESLTLPGGERAPRLLVRRAAVQLGGPSPYNEVVLGEAGRVLEFREKPRAAVSDLAAIALYLFPRRIAARVHEYLASGGNPDAPGHFIEWLVRHEPVHASPLTGVWHDIGTPETLASARHDFEAR